MTLAVRCGFWIVKLDPSGLVVNFAFQNQWSQTRTDTFNASGEIFSIPDQIWRYLAVIGRNLGQISARSRRIQPKIILNDETRYLNWYNPKSTRLKPENPTRSSGLVSGYIFLHLNNSGQVLVGQKPDPALPVDTPNKSKLKSKL